MPPNMKVSTVSRGTNGGVATPITGQTVPMDWDSVDENDGGPTYMSLSASSRHPGGVNTLFADGSVKFVKDTISPVLMLILSVVFVHAVELCLRTAAPPVNSPAAQLLFGSEQGLLLTRSAVFKAKSTMRLPVAATRQMLA